ncbi:MAG: hypothetical protein IPP73_12800 [Chitinophagaceae bacterium]|nr:hypothetical protein [Chitinophagaceae bacterium]
MPQRGTSQSDGFPAGCFLLWEERLVPGWWDISLKISAGKAFYFALIPMAALLICLFLFNQLGSDKKPKLLIDLIWKF